MFVCASYNLMDYVSGIQYGSKQVNMSYKLISKWESKIDKLHSRTASSEPVLFSSRRFALWLNEGLLAARGMEIWTYYMAKGKWKPQREILVNTGFKLPEK
jgi:hypothetical protein